MPYSFDFFKNHFVVPLPPVTAHLNQPLLISGHRNELPPAARKQFTVPGLAVASSSRCLPPPPKEEPMSKRGTKRYEGVVCPPRQRLFASHHSDDVYTSILNDNAYLAPQLQTDNKRTSPSSRNTGVVSMDYSMTSIQRMPAPPTARCVSFFSYLTAFPIASSNAIPLARYAPREPRKASPA
ncbi:unnamed protein product, partial [Ectocarpus sp. 8 AP-2014]